MNENTLCSYNENINTPGHQSFPSLAQDFRSSDNTTDARSHPHTLDLPWDYSRPVHAKVSLGYLQDWQDNDDTVY